MNELLLVRRINDRRAAEWAERNAEQMGKPAQLPLVGDLGRPPEPMNGFDAAFAAAGFDPVRRRQ